MGLPLDRAGPRLPTELPTLHTPRLTLRALNAGDAPALFAIYGDAEVMRFASDPPFAEPATVQTMLASVARLLQQGESLEWGVVELDGGALVGTCGLHSFESLAGSAEVGCLLARRAWGRGLMHEALGAVIEEARGPLGLARLRADIDAANLRSIRLFTHLGFQPVEGSLYERPL
jgi:[ribosomal protein S5]-alanine N-acetyltransferase